MPSLSEKDLEERLASAEKSLAQPPASLDELLHLLDGVEQLLAKVEQSPPNTLQASLNPLMKVLVTKSLLEHSDIDVKVGVASCIIKITRITALDAPYNDEEMKDVFRLIVSSFEGLADVSSRSYAKRATILEAVAKVRSCVIMLDFECDQMIVDMFQHFLKAIRGYHSASIYANMETIMTLVIKESEDISADLLAPILATLRSNNKDASAIAKKLAERVIKNSADKLRPYLQQAVKSLGTSFDEYSEVVASVCRENTDTVGHSNESISKNQPVVEEKCTSASPAQDPGTPVAQDDREGTNYQEKDSTAIRSPKSVVSNGINESGTNKITTEENSSNKVDSEGQLDAKSTVKDESDDHDAQEPEKLEAEAEGEKVQPEAENHDTPDKDVHTSPIEVIPVEADESLDKGEDRSVEAVTEVSKPVEAHSEVSKPVEAATEARTLDSDPGSAELGKPIVLEEQLKAELGKPIVFGERLEATKSFNIVVPDEYKCPISKQLMTDPVITSSGETCDRSSVCDVDVDDLQSNHIMLDMIIAWCQNNALPQIMAGFDLMNTFQHEFEIFQSIIYLLNMGQSMKEAYVSTESGIYWILSAIQRDVNMETEVDIQMDIKSYALYALHLLAASTDSNKEKIGLYNPFTGLKKVLAEGFEMSFGSENILKCERYFWLKKQIDTAVVVIKNLCTVDTNAILAATEGLVELMVNLIRRNKLVDEMVETLFLLSTTRTAVVRMYNCDLIPLLMDMPMWKVPHSTVKLLGHELIMWLSPDSTSEQANTGAEQADGIKELED